MPFESKHFSSSSGWALFSWLELLKAGRTSAVRRSTANLRTEILDFGGFDKHNLKLKGWISHVHRNFKRPSSTDVYFNVEVEVRELVRPPLYNEPCVFQHVYLTVCYASLKPIFFTKALLSSTGTSKQPPKALLGDECAWRDATLRGPRRCVLASGIKSTPDLPAEIVPAKVR